MNKSSTDTVNRMGYLLGSMKAVLILNDIGAIDARSVGVTLETAVCFAAMSIHRCLRPVMI